MEFVYDSLPTLLGAASAAVPMLQTQQLHKKEMERTLELHLQAIRQAKEFHDAERALSLSLHSDALQKALNQHIESIQLTIEAARRENLRDVWAQKSRRAETLLIMSSLMISGFFTLCVEGIPPQTASPVLLVFFAACVAFGFCCLFGSLFVTMKYQSRMSDFNIYNVKQVYSCGMRHEAFESYYECHCSHASKASTLLFYAGTIMLLCATALLQFARWYFAYASLAASVVYVVVAGLGMLGLLGINFMMQTKTRALNSASDAEAAEEDARQMDRGQMGDVPIRRVLSSGGLIRGASRVKSGMRKRKAARTQSDREKQAFEEYVEKKVGKGEERPAQPQAFPPPPPPPAPAPSKLHEQSSVEIATAKDPGNLGNTLSETTRRKLFESQRNIHDAAAIDARVAFNDDSDRSSRLRPSELDVDMDEMFPKDERE